MITLHIFILVFLTFFTRIFPRILQPSSFFSDTYYHLLSAESIRNNHFRIPKTIKGLCFPGPFDYPPLFPYFLAIFNAQSREKIEKFVSAFVDIMLVLIMYFLASDFLNYFIPRAANINISSAAFVCSLLYLLSPALLFFGFGPRAYHATPRAVSELFFYIAMFVLFYFFFYNNLLFLVFSIFFSVLLLLTSKFGAQVLLFFSVIISIFLHTWLLLLTLVLGFIAVLVISKGHYLEVLKGHLGHLILFKKITSKIHPAIQRKNKLINILTLPKDILFNRKKAFGTLIFDNSFVILLMRNPQLVILSSWFLINTKQHLPNVNSQVYFLFIWVIASMIIFIFTSLRPFLFLGEAERYINYSLIPQYILFGFIFSKTKFFTPLVIFLILYSLIMYMVYIYIFLRWCAANRENEFQKKEVFDFLKDYSQNLKILPICEDVYELAYRSKKDVLYPSGNYRIDYLSVEEFKRLYEVFYSPHRDIKYILDKYALNSIFVSNKQLEYLKNNFNIEYDFSSFKKAFENIKYTVYLKE